MVDKYWTEKEAARLDKEIGLVYPTKWIALSTYRVRS